MPCAREKKKRRSERGVCEKSVDLDRCSNRNAPIYSALYTHSTLELPCYGFNRVCRSVRTPELSPPQ
jgi:hypothetical protein